MTVVICVTFPIAMFYFPSYPKQSPIIWPLLSLDILVSKDYITYAIKSSQHVSIRNRDQQIRRMTFFLIRKNNTQNKTRCNLKLKLPIHLTKWYIKRKTVILYFIISHWYIWLWDLKHWHLDNCFCFLHA